MNNMKRPKTQVRFLKFCSRYNLGTTHRPHCYRMENMVLVRFMTLIRYSEHIMIMTLKLF